MLPTLSQGVRLTWSSQRSITQAEGACELVLDRTTEQLLTQPLHSGLQISPERAKQLDLRARSGGGVEFVARDASAARPGNGIHDPARIYLRLELELIDGEATAHVHNVTSLLREAPPLQISHLSSSLSHELRNPLSSVKMTVQTLARNTGLSERDQRRLGIAQREIRTMERMLWMLSEYGRDTPPHLEPVALRWLVQQGVEMIDRELGERQIKILIQEPVELPKVLADPSRIRPVLAQLLLNIALGQEASSCLQVTVTSLEVGPSLVIEDPTSSLLAEEQRTLFEPFGSKLARGAGLSLAALRQVVLRQGGQVTARGGEKSGTTFTLTLTTA
jgi:signal transduction histidine kinase